MRNSLRGKVIEQWEASNRPAWRLEESVKVAVQADSVLEKAKLTPAPEFRRARLAGNESDIRRWVAAARFPWLTKESSTGNGVHHARQAVRNRAALAHDADLGLDKILEDLGRTTSPVYVTRVGEPVAVVLRYDAYRQMVERMEDLEDALAMREALATPADEAMSLDAYERKRANAVQG